MRRLRVFKSIVLPGLLAVLMVMSSDSALAQANTGGAAPGAATTSASSSASTASSDSVPTGTDEGFPYKKTGLGCAAGAVLGSVVPVVGNIVGCVLGGLFGWLR
jgi:hypothetical protein